MRKGEVARKTMADAFDTGCLNYLHTLVLSLVYDADVPGTLRVVLTAIRQGCAPDLKAMHLDTNLTYRDVEILTEFFPLVSAFSIITHGLSENAQTRLREAADKYAGLTFKLRCVA